jgi:hypothetical protein
MDAVYTEQVACLGDYADKSDVENIKEDSAVGAWYDDQ